SIPLDYASPMRSDTTRLIPLLLILAVLLGFGRLEFCDFTFWDDPETVSTNPAMNPPSWHSTFSYWKEPAKGLYAPLTYTTWSALARLPLRKADDSLNPKVFHLANIGLHCLSVLVVYAILLLLFRLPWPAC